MEKNIIDGKYLAKKIREELKVRIEKLKRDYNHIPKIVVVLVGEHKASQVYVNNKIKMAQKLNVESQLLKLDANISQHDLVQEIQKLNQDPNVNGILVQLPLPKTIDEKLIIHSIDPYKDVDGFHVMNSGMLTTDITGGIIPCTPKGCMKLLKNTNIKLVGKKAIVIGKSNIVGKPMALMLLQEGCTVTVAHSKTQNLVNETKNCDIIIAATGVEGLITKEHVKKGAVVIDVGINYNKEGKIVGDVKFDEVKHIAQFITPVPGGVGPMTIASLFENLIEICEKKIWI